MFIPDGSATVTAITTIGIIVSVYVGGRSLTDIKKPKQYEVDW